MRPVKRVVLLHDLCAVGKAALTNMLPVLSTMGLEACPIPTILLSTHTGGYGKPAVRSTDPDYIRECAAHFKREKVSFDGIFVGYPGNTEVLEAVRDFVHCFPEVPVILDPIMGDHGKYYGNFGAVYGKAVRSFVPEAEVLLPNLTEACLLTETPYRTDFTEKELFSLCQKLDDAGRKRRTIVLTSAPASENRKKIAVLMRVKEDESFFTIDFPACPGDYHGTGDLFDGVFLADYIEGLPIRTCIEQAHAFVKNCIQTSSRYAYSERDGLLIEQSLPFLDMKSNERG